MSKQAWISHINTVRFDGRRWKSDLRDCWMRVDYPSSLDSGALQTLRNSESFGPGGLVRFKLSAFVASEVQA
jgi:hypothetical protein